MRSITVRNGHQALPIVLQMLDEQGVRRDSRNGPVIQLPGVLAIEYTHPCERVVFWPERDANPAFHLYEALWMLDGRNDVTPLLRYVKHYLDYSDDGITQRGAYGHRWRHNFGMDQVQKIADALKKNPEDRRQVLQMWDSERDLGWQGKDVPCNLVATFQIGTDDRLDMVVTNRSNDVIWGMLGANLVHFSVLQEHLADQIGCPVGTYTQVTSNAHAYLDRYAKLAKLSRPSLWARVYEMDDPYLRSSLMGQVQEVPMAGVTRDNIRKLLFDADDDYNQKSSMTTLQEQFGDQHPWCRMVRRVLVAHSLWRHHRMAASLDYVSREDDLRQADWIVAMREWVQRRYDRMLDGGELWP